MVILKSKSSTIPSYNYLPFNRSCQTKRSKERCNQRESSRRANVARRHHLVSAGNNIPIGHCSRREKDKECTYVQYLETSWANRTFAEIFGDFPVYKKKKSAKE